MLFEPRDQQLAHGPARIGSGPLPTLGDPLSEFTDQFGAEWERTRAIERSNSRTLMLQDALQPYLDRYQESTGRRLTNPYALPDDSVFQDVVDLLPGFEDRRTALARDMRAAWDKARQERPDLGELPSDDGLLQAAIAAARTADEQAEMARAKRDSAAGGVGGFLGGMGSAMADPWNLATLWIGAGAASGVLRTMAVEAAAGAGVEAVLQPGVVSWKREIGQDPGLLEIAGNVALAGFGAGTLAGAIKSLPIGWQAVRRSMTREQADAVRVAAAADRVDARNPIDLVGRKTVEMDAPAAAEGAPARAGDLDGPTAPRQAGDAPARPDALDETELARLNAREANPVETRALHRQALQEAEAAIDRGEPPAGPAIDRIAEKLGPAAFDLELPMRQVVTRTGRRLTHRGPMDLVTWLRANGGLKEGATDRGELTARDFHKMNGGRKGVPYAGSEAFYGRLVHPNGMSLDDAALAAWERGYFPGFADRPTPDDLLAAVDRTLAAGPSVDGRAWSELDADLVEQLRGRIDPDEEAHARERLGDDLVDEALATQATPLAARTGAGEQIRQAVDDIRQRAAGRTAAEAERLAPDEQAARLEELQQLIDEDGDFEVELEIDDGDQLPRTVRMSARELWRQTQLEAAQLDEGLACMAFGAVSNG